MLILILLVLTITVESVDRMWTEESINKYLEIRECIPNPILEEIDIALEGIVDIKHLKKTEAQLLEGLARELNHGMSLCMAFKKLILSIKRKYHYAINTGTYHRSNIKINDLTKKYLISKVTVLELMDIDNTCHHIFNNELTEQQKNDFYNMMSHGPKCAAEKSRKGLFEAIKKY